VIREVEKEVVREVPVQKVVLVDKPVEIVKKEIVYVPFYTDDRSQIKLSKEQLQALGDGEIPPSRPEAARDA
jgi:hypothetical protein